MKIISKKPKTIFKYELTGYEKLIMAIFKQRTMPLLICPNTGKTKSALTREDKTKVEKAIKKLTEIEEQIVRAHYGINSSPQTLKAISQQLLIPYKDIRNNLSNAISWLQDPLNLPRISFFHFQHKKLLAKHEDLINICSRLSVLTKASALNVSVALIETLFTPISALNLNLQLISILNKDGIVYLCQLANQPNDKLLDIKGIGEKNIHGLKKRLYTRLPRRQDSYYSYNIKIARLLCPIKGIFSERIEKLLYDNNIFYIFQLVVYSRQELLSVFDQNELYLERITKKINYLGFEWSMEIPKALKQIINLKE